MACCGSYMGRRRRRTSSIYEKIVEEKAWNEYYRRLNIRRQEISKSCEILERKRRSKDE